MGKFFDDFKHKLEDTRNFHKNLVIDELREELKPFFEKYEKIKAIKYTSDVRGDDEGEWWTQFNFSLITKTGRTADGMDSYDSSVYFSDIIDEIPFNLKDFINAFGNQDIILTRALM
jgi:hypothetical protein